MLAGSKRKRLHEGRGLSPRRQGARRTERGDVALPNQGYHEASNDLDMASDSLSNKDHLRLIHFLNHPLTLEGKTRRYRLLLTMLASIGDDLNRACGLVDGALKPECIALIREAASMSPFKPTASLPAEDTQPCTPDGEDGIDDDSDDDENLTNDSSTRPALFRSAKVQNQVLNILEASQTPPRPRRSRTSGTPLRLSPGNEVTCWRTTWERVVTAVFGPNHPTWLADVTTLLDQITSTTCLAKIVSLADEFYESRVVFELYSNTNTEDQLRASTDAARDVALKFKELWSKHQSDVVKEWTELYRYLELGRAIIRLVVEMADTNTQIGKAFNESRPRGSRRKTTEAAMNTFMIAHLLKIMDFTGDKDSLEQARRKLKRQRMTAMNTLLFVEAFGEGVLLQLLGARWAAILPQFSYRSLIQPILTLASEHPEFRINARLAEINIADFTKDRTRIGQLPRKAILAQSVNSRRYPSYSMAELLSRPGSDSQTGQRLDLPESSPLAKQWLSELQSGKGFVIHKTQVMPGELSPSHATNDTQDSSECEQLS